MPAFEFGSTKKSRSNKGKETATTSSSNKHKPSERTLSHLENEEDEDSG